MKIAMIVLFAFVGMVPSSFAQEGLTCGQGGVCGVIVKRPPLACGQGGVCGIMVNPAFAACSAKVKAAASSALSKSDDETPVTCEAPTPSGTNEYSVSCTASDGDFATYVVDYQLTAQSCKILMLEADTFQPRAAE